jgi:enoyl-CoA hydratase
MNYQNLLIETIDQMVHLTINRPKALNALNREVMKELHLFFGEDLPARAGVMGVILTGSGDRSFVAGADVTEFLGLTEEEGRQMAEFGQSVFMLVERSEVPVVAVINGFALGGGCELAMACHLRIAEEHARFGQPEVNLGLIPGYGGTQRLVRYVGKTKAMELILTADMITAQEALELGLVNQVAEKGEGLEKARELLRKIGTKGPLAVARAIESVNACFEHGKNGFDEEAKGFGRVIGSSDSQEGVQAFLEKRKAEFKGK